MAHVAVRPQQVLPEVAQATPNPEGTTMGPNEVTFVCRALRLLPCVNAPVS